MTDECTLRCFEIHAFGILTPKKTTFMSEFFHLPLLSSLRCSLGFCSTGRRSGSLPPVLIPRNVGRASAGSGRHV